MSVSLVIQRHHDDVERDGRPRTTLRCSVSDCRGPGCYSDQLHIEITRPDASGYDYGSVSIFTVTEADCDALEKVARQARAALAATEAEGGES